MSLTDVSSVFTLSTIATSTGRLHIVKLILNHMIL